MACFPSHKQLHTITRDYLILYYKESKSRYPIPLISSEPQYMILFEFLVLYNPIWGRCHHIVLNNVIINIYIYTNIL